MSRCSSLKNDRKNDLFFSLSDAEAHDTILSLQTGSRYIGIFTHLFCTKTSLLHPVLASALQVDHKEQ